MDEPVVTGTPDPVAAPVADTPAPAVDTGAQDRLADRPVTRREQIADALAKNAEAAGDKSVRQRMIERGVIRPAGTPHAIGRKEAIGQKPGAIAGQRDRDPQGKFVPKAPVVAPAPAAGQQPQITPVVQQPQRPPLPKWLAKEIEPHWNESKPELLQAVLKYGEDASKGIEKYKTGAQQAQALLAEFEPYRDILQAENGTPQTAIRGLLQTAAALRRGDPQTKAQLVAQTMQNFGIPLAHIAQMFGVQLADAQGNILQTQPAPQVDPNVRALMQKVQTLESSIQSRHQQEQEQEAARLAKIAESFGKERPHYETLKPQIAGILNGGLVGDVDGKSEMEILQAAYDMALRLNPELYAQSLAQASEQAAKAERDKANKAAQASRAASVQVRGAPGGPAAPAFDPKDRAAVIRHAIAVNTR